MRFRSLHRSLALAVAAIAGAALVNCANDPGPGRAGAAGAGAEAAPARVPLGLLPAPEPADNPTAAASVALGERLFFDQRLSGDGARSCATCHIPELAFTERRPVALDPQDRPHRRNTQTIQNVAYLPLLLWDGSARSLEEQAFMPLVDTAEMNASVDHVLTVVETDSSYVRLFDEAFAAPPSKARIAAALAAYQRTLLAGDSPFDRYLFGRDRDALTPAQIRGLEVYIRANCILCHEFFHPTVHPLGGSYALFTDGLFHNLGVGFRDGIMSDLGRYRIAQRPADWGAFRTPTLRNVARTAPYMHDGSLATLREVVEFYNRGGIPNPGLDPAIAPLGLGEEEIDDLVAFLEALTTSSLPAEHPAPADLPAGGRPR